MRASDLRDSLRFYVPQTENELGVSDAKRTETMTKSKDGWKFVVDYIGGKTSTWADGITVTDSGWLKLWRKKQLVGVIKDGNWTRIYLDANQGSE